MPWKFSCIVTAENTCLCMVHCLSNPASIQQANVAYEQLDGVTCCLEASFSASTAQAHDDRAFFARVGPCLLP